MAHKQKKEESRDGKSAMSTHTVKDKNGKVVLTWDSPSVDYLKNCDQRQQRITGRFRD